MKSSAIRTGNRKMDFNGATAFDFSDILRGIPTLKQVKPADSRRKGQKGRVASSSTGEKMEKSSLKNLAEAIILQSIADLWSKTHRRESIEFFTGDGFRQCADMADMSVVDRLRIIRMLRKVNAEAFTPRHTQKLARLAKSL